VLSQAFEAGPEASGRGRGERLRGPAARL